MAEQGKLKFEVKRFENNPIIYPGMDESLGELKFK